MKNTDPVAAAAGVMARVTTAADAKAEDSEVVAPPDDKESPSTEAPIIDGEDSDSEDPTAEESENPTRGAHW